MRDVNRKVQDVAPHASPAPPRPHLLQLALAALALVGAAAGCASTGGLPNALAGAPPPPVVAYHLELAPRQATVDIQVLRPTVDPYPFVTWPVDDGAPEARWYAMTATTAAGRALSIETDDGGFRVLGAGAEDFTVHYLVIDQRAGFDAGDSPRWPLTTNAATVAFGGALFAIPARDGDQRLYEDARLEITAPDTWNVQSTWGRKSTHFAHAEDLWDALLTAGSFRYAEGRADRSALFLAVDHAWADQRDPMISEAERVARYLAFVFGRYPLNASMMTVVPGSEVPTAVTVPGGMLVLVPATSTDGVRVRALMAQAHFQLARDALLTPRATPDQPWPAWFHEGTAVYYGLRTLLALDALDSNAFCQIVNGWVRDALHNPWSQLAPAHPEDPAFWASPDGAALARSRGALLALLIDIYLRTESQGVKSLDLLLRKLAFDLGDTGQGYTEADVLTRLTAVSDRDWAPFIDSFVHGSEPLDLTYLDRGGILLTAETLLTYDLGLRWRPAGPELAPEVRFVVTRVDDGSSAAREGIVVGDLIGDVQLGPEVAELVILRPAPEPEPEPEPAPPTPDDAPATPDAPTGEPAPAATEDAPHDAPVPEAAPTPEPTPTEGHLTRAATATCEPPTRYESTAVTLSPWREVTVPVLKETTGLFNDWFRGFE